MFLDQKNPKKIRKNQKKSVFGEIREKLVVFRALIVGKDAKVGKFRYEHNQNENRF